MTSMRDALDVAYFHSLKCRQSTMKNAEITKSSPKLFQIWNHQWRFGSASLRAEGAAVADVIINKSCRSRSYVGDSCITVSSVRLSVRPGMRKRACRNSGPFVRAKASFMQHAEYILDGMPFGRRRSSGGRPKRDMCKDIMILETLLILNRSIMRFI